MPGKIANSRVKISLLSLHAIFFLRAESSRSRRRRKRRRRKRRKAPFRWLRSLMTITVRPRVALTVEVERNGKFLMECRRDQG